MPAFLICLTFLLLLASGPVEAVQSNPCAVARELQTKAIALLDSKPDEAIKAFQNAQSICSTDVAIGFNLGLALYQTGQKAEALKIWEKLLETFPDHEKTHTNLAWMQFETGDDKKAIILASDGFNKHPGNLSIAHTKLYALFRRGHYLEAYDWIMRMRALEQEEAETGLTGNRVDRWQEMAAGFVVETLWRQFQKGERMDALRQSINLLVKEYPKENLFVQAKDQLLQAYTNPDAEIPHPRPLPHEVWAKSGDIDNHNDVLDEIITTLPPLPAWQKRSDAFAVITGINRYKRIKARHFADQDANNVHQLLTRRGVFLDDSNHIRLRLNQAADHQTLKKDLEWLIQQGQQNPNAMLLFYFSGLGLSWSQSNSATDALLLPVDVKLDTMNPDHAVSLAWLKESLSRLPNKEVVLLLDVCFNGTPACAIKIDQSPMAVKRDFFLSSKPMAIAAENLEAALHGPGQQSALTWYLLKGMLGEADGANQTQKDGWVDLNEAFAFVKDKLPKHNPPADPILSLPTPMRLTKTGGEQ